MSLQNRRAFSVSRPLYDAVKEKARSEGIAATTFVERALRKIVGLPDNQPIRVAPSIPTPRVTKKTQKIEDVEPLFPGLPRPTYSARI